MKSKIMVIDRFEGDIAVCETEGRVMRDIPRAQVAPGAREGDRLVWDGVQWQVSAGDGGKEELRARMNRLWTSAD